MRLLFYMFIKSIPYIFDFIVLIRLEKVTAQPQNYKLNSLVFSSSLVFYEQIPFILHYTFYFTK
jgi:hypothetical protein